MIVGSDMQVTRSTSISVRIREQVWSQLFDATRKPFSWTCSNLYIYRLLHSMYSRTNSPLLEVLLLLESLGANRCSGMQWKCLTLQGACHGTGSCSRNTEKLQCWALRWKFPSFEQTHRHLQFLARRTELGIVQQHVQR